jgi:hypothetical protein
MDWSTQESTNYSAQHRLQHKRVELPRHCNCPSLWYIRRNEFVEPRRRVQLLLLLALLGAPTCRILSSSLEVRLWNENFRERNRNLKEYQSHFTASVPVRLSHCDSISEISVYKMKSFPTLLVLLMIYLPTIFANSPDCLDANKDCKKHEPWCFVDGVRYCNMCFVNCYNKLGGSNPMDLEECMSVVRLERMKIC